jgi:hypothetical protein
MTVRRTPFFLVLISIIIVPFLTHKIIWLAGSEKTNGTMSFIGKTFSGQMDDVYSVIWFMAGKDTVWFNGRNNIFFEEGAAVPVRYQRSHPEDAKINVFLSIWGDTLIYGGLPLLILLIIFAHPEIVPYRSRIRLVFKTPFIRIV